MNNIGTVIAALKQGMRAERVVWDAGHFLELDRERAEIALRTPHGTRPWTAPHSDILASDWRITQKNMNEA